MSEGRAEIGCADNVLAETMRAAGLRVEEERLGELASLLDAAAAAASRLDEAAGRVSVGDALAEFDPAWREGER